MTRRSFSPEHPVLRLSVGEFDSIPAVKPDMITEARIGYRWRERCWGGARVHVLTGIGHDGPLIETYRPVIRAAAISRHVPRQVTA